MKVFSSFHLRYLLIFLLLLATEIIIARFFSDTIIRPFVGDVLAVILLYYFFRTFIRGYAQAIAIGAFLFACSLEAVQWFRLAEIWDLHPMLRIVLGSTFDIWDIIAYAVGFIICFVLSSKESNKN